VRSYRRTKTAWFGPKRYLGWGWKITSWRGALTTAVFIALNGAATFWRGPGNRLGFLLTVHGVLVVLFLAVIVLTGDPPGGPMRARR
jgi:signal transduction histidine kinase